MSDIKVVDVLNVIKPSKTLKLLQNYIYGNATLYLNLNMRILINFVVYQGQI